MKEHCLSYQACLSNSDLEELKVYYHALKRSFDLVKEQFPSPEGVTRVHYSNAVLLLKRVLFDDLNENNQVCLNSLRSVAWHLERTSYEQFRGSQNVDYLIYNSVFLCTRAIYNITCLYTEAK